MSAIFSITTMLKSSNITLRAPEPEDLEIIYNWENNTEVWEVSNTIVPFSKFVLKQYLETAHLDIYTNKQLRLIILENSTGKAVGAIDLFDFDPFNNRAGVGILINDTNDRQKGLAQESLKIVIDYCFNFVGLKQLYCNITSDNKASIKLFENAGFVVSGNKKSWIKSVNGWKDELFLQLINE